ncbi:MAG: phospholipid carrier-dependent glycosyltransferase [Magnetococcales bacterium]|nr:glycosyltransferase family 39 protein [Magnetococcales bacterium]NGZ07303.1 phospholipid carrier-dependent glycosyltransferase [Magnetococcales bacterium]
MNHQPSSVRHRLLLGILILLASFLASRGLFDPDVGWPDADRIVMDGVFIHDFLRDLQFGTLFSVDFPARIYQYAVDYYTQYPSLSLGAKPPLFPFVESIFFFLFGVNDLSAKASVILFSIIGLIAWYDLVRQTHDHATAWLSSGLLFTTPFIVYWSWYTMLEIPVLAMALVTANTMWRYVETRANRWLYWSAFALSLSMWTKQAAFFMVPWFLIWMILLGRTTEMLRDRAVWKATALVIVLNLPLLVLSIWLGKNNMALAFEGVRESHRVGSWFDWSYLRQYIDILIRDQVTIPVLLLSLIGFATSLYRRDRQTLIYFSLIVGTFLFFTALRSFRIDRYTIFWVPGFALFAVIPIHHFRKHPLFQRLGTACILAVMVYQIHLCQTTTPAFTKGHQEAARFAIEQSKNGRIFMDGVNNGYFIYYVRLNDPNRNYFILRGDKLLHSSNVMTEDWTQIHTHDLQGIRSHLDQHGIDILVVEESNYTNLEIHQMLRDHLKSDAFELLKTIPVHSSRSSLKNQSLLIYRYKQAKAPGTKRFKLSLPIVGITLDTSLPPVER